jgi:cytidine deaminase
MIIKRTYQMASPYHTGITKSNHMCAILDINGNPLIFGSNFYNTKINITTHAEVDAFDKLVNKMGRTRRKITIDLVIIRTNGGNSKPCEDCQKKIHMMSIRFCIRNIYYTNNDYDIEMIKFSKL